MTLSDAIISVHRRAEDPELSKKIIWTLITTVVGLVFLVVPLFTSAVSYWFYMASAVTMATAFNYIAGLTGYMPFGYVAFYGIGAYAFGILLKTYDAPVVVSLAAALIAGLAAALVLSPTLRLRSVYFGIVSLALAIICRLSVSLLPESFAGGSLGLVLSRGNDPIAAYYTLVVVMILSLAIGGWLATSRLGLALRAIREDEEVAALQGVDVPRARTRAWLLAAAVPALTGAIEAWYSNAIDLDSAFDLMVTTKTIVYAMAGGLGFAVGPVIGAIAVYAADQVVWALFPAVNQLFFGLLVVLLVIRLPRGVVGQFAFRHSRLRRYIP